MEIKLRKPVNVNGESIDRLTLREPEIGEYIKAMEHIALRSDIEAIDNCYNEFLVQVTALNQSIIDALPGSVIDAAADYFNSLILPNPDNLPEREYIEREQARLTALANSLGDEYRLVLDKPIIHGEVTLTDFVIKEPTNAQRRKANLEIRNGDNKCTRARQGLKLLALASGEQEAVLKRLPISKFTEATEVLGCFRATVSS